MLHDTFATSQIQFVFEITLIALKYKQSEKTTNRVGG
jgi:hypothetical protein